MNPSEYVKTFLLSYVALEHEKFMLQKETEMTPKCSQESNEEFHNVALEPLNSNPSNPYNLILDSDGENSSDSSDSVDIGVILKQKLKTFCFKAIKSHDSTWKQAIDFVENIELYYENNLI